jgi:GNAT superfamily N-acetyltransferase
VPKPSLWTDTQGLGFSFAPTTADDIDDLVCVRLAAMQPGLEALGRFRPEKARQHVVDNYRPKQTYWIRHEHLPQRLGWLCLYACTRPPHTSQHGKDDLVGPYWQLDRFYFSPQTSGKGWGSRVLSYLCKQADEADRPIQVTALLGSAANRFYQRHGFIFVDQGDIDVNYVRPAPLTIIRGQVNQTIAAWAARRKAEESPGSTERCSG